MIDETFLRQCVRDLNSGDNVYIYNNDFIDIITSKYYEKYKKTVYLEKRQGYCILTTKKRGGTQYEIIKK